jgi:hypothetical protein
VALGKYFEDIALRRCEDGARIVYEYQHPQPAPSYSQPWGSLGLSPEKLADLRNWVQRVNKECEERLAREMVLHYEFNKERTTVVAAQYVTKGDAAKAAFVPGGELLDLDVLYGGALVLGRHIFISEAAFERCLLRHGSDLTTSALFDDLFAEREAKAA